jgi:hypothetical protein
MLWRAWLAPSPSPPSPLGSERGEGGELLKGHVLPGNSKRGVHWRAYLAGKSGVSFWRTKVAGPRGRVNLAGPEGRVNLVDQSGGSNWQVHLAGL